MLDVYIVSENLGDELEVLKNSNKNFYIHFLDITSKNDRSKAYKLKGAWGARMNPFICINDGDKTIKCFYSETGEDVYKQLLKFINSYNG